MPFLSSALTAGQLTSLRGTAGTPPTFNAAQYLCVAPNTIVFQTTIFAIPNTASYAQLSFGATIVGSSANVKVDMTVLIGSTNDPRAATWAGRVRLAVSGSTLYIDETSAAFTAGQYIWVIEDYRVWNRLPRDVSGLQYKDYDLVFRQIPPVIAGLQTAYAGFVSSATSNLRIAFNISASYAATSGATISSYAWTFPAGTTVISGSVATAIVTIDFPASAGNWCSVVVTDSGGRTTTRHFIVFPCNSTTFPPATGFTGASITGDLQNGYSASIDAFTGISSVYDNTLVCIFEDANYNGTQTSLLSSTNIQANVMFVGRLRTEGDKSSTDEQYSLINQTHFELEGTGQQLSRVAGALITMTYKASPTLWDQITNLTIWRAIVHLLMEHSTFLTLHDLTFDDVTNAFLALGLNTQGANLLGVVNDLAVSINAAMEFAPSGEARVVRNANYLTTAQRNALVTVINYTTQDYIDLGLDIPQVDLVGRGDVSGGFFNSADNTVTPLLSIAPGIAQDAPEGISALTRQILTANSTATAAQSELNTRAGHHLQVVNPTPKLSVSHPDGYVFPIPSLAAWYTWTLDTTTNIRGISYTTATRWFCNRIQIDTDNTTGTRTVQAEYTQETSGDAGQTLQYPQPASLPTDPSVSLPPFDPFPNLNPDPISDITVPNPIYGDPFADPLDPTSSSQPTKTGDSVLITTSNNRVFITKNFIGGQSNPTWIDVTPTDLVTNAYTVVHAIFDLRFNGRTYVLANDGTNSYVYSVANVFANNLSWTKSAALAGVYKKIRAFDTAGTVAIYKVTGGSTSTISSDFSNTIAYLGPSYSGIGFSGTGANQDNAFGNPAPSWVSQYTANVGGPGVDGIHVGIKIDLAGSATPTNFAFDLYATAGIAAFHSVAYTIQILDAGSAVLFAQAGNFDPGSATWGNHSFAFAHGAARYATIEIAINSPGIASEKMWLDNGIITISSTGGAAVRYSTDYGATFGSENSLGSGPGTVGGFDIIRVGNVTFGGANNSLSIATSINGAFGPANGGTTGTQQPTFCLVPWYQWGSNSATNYSTSTPHYLLGAGGLSGGACLWRVNHLGVRTNITPASVTGILAPDCGMTWKGTKAGIIGDVSGTPHLFTSTTIGSTDTWTDRGALNAGAAYIRGRRLSLVGNQLFYANGTVLGYSADFGATLQSKNGPDGGTIGTIEVYG